MEYRNINIDVFVTENVEDGRGMEKDELLDTNKDQILNSIGNDNHHRSNTVKVM